MGFTLQTTIPVLTVLAQGVLSFFSPCVLPLLPVYFGFLSGGTTDTDGEGKPDTVRTMVNTVCFVAGISFSFFLLALGMTAFGAFFQSKQTLIARIGGVLVLLLGVYQTGLLGKSALLSRELRLPFRLDRAASSPLTALMLGFVFSFSWTPCVGPALSAVLLMAASSPSRAWGLFLIAVYTVGFAVPFLVTGLFTSSLLRLFHEHRATVRFTERAGGVLLILMGLFLLTGGMDRLSANLSETQTTQLSQEADTNPGGAAVPYETDDEQTEEEQTEEETGDTDTMPAVDFELTDQYGTTRRLSDYQGKVVFLNFWATWCPPCRAEMPDIQKIYEETQSGQTANGEPTQSGLEDVVILGVATPGLGSEKDEEGIRDFLEENGYTYPVAMDTTGEVFAAYGISAIPTTFMINRAGNVLGYVPGSMSEEVMRSIIDQTLNADT